MRGTAAMKFSLILLTTLASSVAGSGFRGTTSGSPRRVLGSKGGCKTGLDRVKTSKGSRGDELFRRIATFPICSQIDLSEGCNSDTETVAEIVAVSMDGMTLVYTDAAREVLGFVDITDPAAPAGLGTVSLGGEPTSVAVLGEYALVAVNTSPDFVNPSGFLNVIKISDMTIVTTIDLEGQPDSVAISPDGSYAAVAIENERDEDLGDGGLPQLPAGFLVVIDTSDSDPTAWSTTKVELTGLAGVTEPTDPEPEFVSINNKNKAVVTLQENNAIVIVDLNTKTVEKSYSAGTVDLNMIDTVEDDIINQTSSLSDVPREPDGVVWISPNYFATADEGDLDGGSRGFTIFNEHGSIAFTSGNELELLAAKLGHYPEDRSENKGNEPENVAYGEFGGDKYKYREKLLFVNSERSSLVFVYKVNNVYKPKLLQVLPTGFRPEGGLTIPDRDLLVIASEEDSREDVYRSALNIYQYGSKISDYPTLESIDRFKGGPPIPWGALSGLAADRQDCNTLYSIHDNFYKQSRIFVIDASDFPAHIVKEIYIKDTNDILSAVPVDTEFGMDDLAALINDDKTVNLDLEGIAVSENENGYWLVSEGSGTAGDTSRPIESLNFLIKVDKEGVIEKVVTLPADVNAIQVRFGFEGVAEGLGDFAGNVVVAFQRAWKGEPHPRIGVYNIVDDEWEFFFYPLDPVESPNGGWVGLSDIAPLDDGSFMLVERDNQGGPDAAIKRLYSIDLKSTCNLPPGDSLEFPLLEKRFVRDLLPDLQAFNGLTPEKVEGLAVTASGQLWIVNDNDGVDDNNGETLLIQI